MTNSLRAAAVVAALAAGTTALPSPAAADSFARTAFPVVLYAATGAVIGAVIWPAVFPAAVGTASSVAPVVWSWDAFLTTRAAIGAVAGAALGYTIAP